MKCTNKCTRCDKELIEGVNIHEGWHLPICRDCRIKIMNEVRKGKWKDWELDKKEKKIMKERYKEEQKRGLRKVFSRKKKQPKVEKYYEKPQQIKREIKIKLIEDFEKRAFLWLFEGFVTTIAWICVLGLMQITTGIKVYSWFGIFPVLNFLGFEGYFIWIIAVGKIKQMRER